LLGRGWKRGTLRDDLHCGAYGRVMLACHTAAAPRSRQQPSVLLVTPHSSMSSVADDLQSLLGGNQCHLQHGCGEFVTSPTTACCSTLLQRKQNPAEMLLRCMSDSFPPPKDLNREGWI